MARTAPTVAARRQIRLPLAEAKLAPPRGRAGLVRRPQVLRAIDAGSEAALILVAAPAGYGKTTAVRAWCADRDPALAWVTLDTGDNDPIRLWTYIATAVDRIREGLGRGALQRLRTPGAQVEPAVDELMNGIATFDEEVVLVLDDLQTITDGECTASIDYALERLAPNAHILAISRADPGLKLAQLRARGALAVVRADELAFTAAEARELVVTHTGIELDTDEVELLRERTEGWPAALALATLWLKTVEDPHLAVREFGGDHRFVADYLTSEVIDALDDDAQSFLLRASVLGRFTADLCDGVLGRADSASLLGKLERSNLFITRLALGGWYRVHPLFAEFAGYHLAARDPAAPMKIHRRAASWLRSHELPAEAAEHAAAARDPKLVADLLVEYHLVLLRNGGERTLLREVEALPDEVVIAHPELAVGAATAATMVGHAALECRRLLKLSRRSRQEQREHFGSYVQAAEGMVRAATLEGGVGEGVRAGRRAVKAAETDAPDVLVAALGGYARALFFAGELAEARSAALRAVEHPDAEHRALGHLFAWSTLALVAAEEGHLEFARAHAEKARSLVGGMQGGRSWLGANASVALGSVLAAEGHLPEAERELVYAERFFKDDIATVHHAWLLVLLARVRGGRGRVNDAEDAVRAARWELDELPDGGRVCELAASVERELGRARAQAAHGDVLEPPSEAELAVLRLLASDLSVREIGGTLFLSPNTVRSHTRAIYRKLAVNSRTDAVARADVLGLLGELESPM